MSEDNKNMDGVQTQKPSGNDEPKDASVSKKAYEEVARDMHKFKDRAKKAEERANQYEAELKAREEREMQEREEWKALYEKREAEINQIRQEALDKEQRLVRTQKLAALKQELGGSIKDEYLGFANLDAITITETGSIDVDTLREVANQYRQEHGQLIPSKENTNITGQAGSNFDNFQPKPLDKMSHEEKVAALKEIYANKQ